MTGHMGDEDRERIGRIADNSTRLLNEVIRLRTDVQRLHSRIEPFEGERLLEYPAELHPRVRNLKDALDGISEARKMIESCERDFAKVRSVIDVIADDVVSREDMRPYLKSKTPEAR